MNIPPIFLKMVLATLVLSSSVSVFANNLALKVAVVKDVTSSSNLVRGNYHSSIKAIKKYRRAGSSYDNNLNLCVAYIQAGKTVKSESACTAAIKSIEDINLQSEQALYLKSLSYNNRAISRYKSDDISGALADLNIAVLIDSNDITKSNLNAIKQYIYNSANDKSVSDTSVSDNTEIVAD